MVNGDSLGSFLVLSEVHTAGKCLAFILVEHEELGPELKSEGGVEVGVVGVGGMVQFIHMGVALQTHQSLHDILASHLVEFVFGQLDMESPFLCAVDFFGGLRREKVAQHNHLDLLVEEHPCKSGKALGSVESSADLTPLIRFSKHKTIIALKGSKAPEEIVAASKKLELLGYSQPEVLTLGLDKAPETATVVRTTLK